MDALALLCHLSADGAGTLVRLRHAGYATLQDVLLADDDDLAEVLETGAREVARLRREAESLEDRIGDASEAEPRPALSRPAPPAPVPGPAARPTPLLCQLETEPLSEEEVAGETPTARSTLAAQPGAAQSGLRAQDREPQASEPPRRTDERQPRVALRRRYWMSIRRETEEQAPDPGPSGPFA